jgi:hypothetical protein
MIHYHKDMSLPTGSAIFVFGSNLDGLHDAGAALVAKKQYGAQMGIGIGLNGNSYAIPTKISNFVSMTLPEINHSVMEFLEYAKQNPTKEFFVTRIGCGLAGYNNFQIAPMFKNCPENCSLPREWEDCLDGIC